VGGMAFITVALALISWDAGRRKSSTNPAMGQE
jgi:hypothetical protein